MGNIDLSKLGPLDNVYVYDGKILIRVFKEVGTNEDFLWWVENLSNEQFCSYIFIIIST